MYVPELFGPAPTLIHDDIAGTAQPYGSSSLPGAPIPAPSPIVPATVSTAYNVPDISIPPITSIPWHTGGTGLTVAPTSGGSDSPTGGRHFAAPTGPASDVSTPSTPTTPIMFVPPSSDMVTPATTTAAATTTPTDTNDVFGKLIALAGSQQGGGGGGGGLVALPTGIAESGAASGGGGISKATLFLLIAAIAIGVYFYSRHKKKSGEKGAEKKND